MKKRVLSMVLALALCVTAFSGIAFAKAPAGRVETNVDRVDNLLSGIAIPEQQEKINGVAETATVDEEMLKNLVWDPSNPDYESEYFVITKEMLDKGYDEDGHLSLEECQTLSYFVLLSLHDDVESGAITEDNYENLYKLIKGDPEAVDDDPAVQEVMRLGFDGIDAKYNTADMPLNEAFGMFDDYGDDLTRLYASFMEDDAAQIELYGFFGFLDDVMQDVVIPDNHTEEEIKKWVEDRALEIYRASGRTITPEDAVAQAIEEANVKFGTTISTEVDKDAALDKVMTKGQECAHTEITAIVEKYIPMAFQQSVEGYVKGSGDGNYLARYREFMHEDRDKKEAAIVIGKDLMKVVTGGGIMAKISSYVKEKNKQGFLTGTNGILADANRRARLFNADNQTANDELVAVVNDIVTELTKDAADGNNSGLDEAVFNDINNLVKEIEARGLTLEGLVKSAEYVLDTIDNENLDFQNIWYNLGLGRLVDVSVYKNDYANDNGEGSAQLDVALRHDLIDKQFKDPDKAFKLDGVSAYFTFKAAEGETDVTDIEGNFVDYTAESTDPVEVTLDVFRSGAVPVDEFDVDRYLTTVTLELKGKEPTTPPEDEDWTIENFLGDDVKVGADATWEEVLSKLTKTLTVATEGGIKSDELTITWVKPADFDNHGDEITVDGTYTAPADRKASGAVDGKVAQKVVFEAVKPVYTVDIKEEDEANDLLKKDAYVLDENGQAEITVETKVENVPLVVIAVTEKGGKPANTGLVYQTIDKYQAESYTFTIDESVLGDKESMDFMVAVGNTAFENAYDQAFFTVKKTGEPVVLVPVWEKETNAVIRSVKRNTLWEDIKGIDEYIGKTMEFVGEDGQVVEALNGKYTITFDSTQYDPKDRSNQTVTGTYDLEALEAELAELGYCIGEESARPKNSYLIDGEYQLSINRPSSGNGGGGGGYTSTYFTDGTKYDGNKTIHLVGDTSNTRVVIDLVGPDGKVLKTVTLTAAQFINGYDWDVSDLLPFAEGAYNLILRSTYGDEYDKLTFNVGKSGTVITSDIFDKTDHFNYIMGFNDGTVRPEAYITRDEVAAIMFRLLTNKVRTDNLTNSTDQFTDLPDGHWAMTAFATLNTMGIFRGRGDGIMGVGDDITRAEFAALCSRFAVVSASDLTTDYTDIAGNWAEEEIKTVTAAGWFQGSNGLFRPDDKITRAEVVTAINRIIGRDKVGAEAFGNNDVEKFSDLSKDAWYYVDMIEATVPHEYEVADGKETWTKVDDTVDWTVFEQ